MISPATLAEWEHHYRKSQDLWTPKRPSVFSSSIMDRNVIILKLIGECHRLQRRALGAAQQPAGQGGTK